MKKLIFISVLIFIAGTLRAQITITSSDLPSAGDTLRYSVISNSDTMITKNYKKTGLNFIWDFSNLKPISQGIDEYKSALQTPYPYFVGKFGLKITDSIVLGTYKLEDIYNFFGKSASVYTVDGMGVKISGIPVPALYSDKDEIYKLPLTYSTKIDTSTFYFSTIVPGLVTYIKAGKRINQVDGYGTIITPYGSFDCIRVKTIILETDSVKVSMLPFPIGFPNNQVEYKWLAKGMKIPALEVSGNLTGTNVTITKVRFRDKYRQTTPLPGPRISFTASKLTGSIGDTINFTNKTTGTGNTYKWTFSPNYITYLNGTSSTSKEPIVSFDQNGIYNVSLHAENSLGSSDTIKYGYIIISPSSINDPNPIETDLQIYPNPLNNNNLSIIFIMDIPGQVMIRLTDLNGKTIHLLSDQFEKRGKINYSFDLQKFNLPESAYIIEIIISGKKISRLLLK